MDAPKSKRKESSSSTGRSAKYHEGTSGKKPVEGPSGSMEFDDPFGDDFEKERVIVEPGTGELIAVPKEDEGMGTTPGELVFDPSAYDLLHRLNMEWSCLSFDFLPDKLGYLRKTYPHTALFVAGSQALSGKGKDKIFIVKASDLAKTKHDDDGEDSDEDMEDVDPVIEHKELRHPGAVNRIRVMQQHPNIVASWSSQAEVHIWDIAEHVKAFDEPPTKRLNQRPLLQSLTKHKKEGFALDWSPVTEGSLLTGDCKNEIFLWQAEKGGKWSGVSGFRGHSGSVEDLQWSPTQPNVFGSCSVDKTIRIWDTRTTKQSKIDIRAHNTDVNVISWNRKVTYLMISGGDDGIFKIWDMRSLKSPAAEFKWHKGPITSVEWSPHEDSVLAVSSADNTLSIWDLAVEKDEDAIVTGTAKDDIPPQLLFVHEGQKDIKELHWHRQIPGALGSTALDGVNLFKPANID